MCAPRQLGRPQPWRRRVAAALPGGLEALPSGDETFDAALNVAVLEYTRDVCRARRSP